jgi:oxaloacetate decarboxylase beta subunit
LKTVSNAYLINKYGPKKVLDIISYKIKIKLVNIEIGVKMTDILNFLYTTGFPYIHYTNLIMMSFGLLFIYLGIKKNFEPLLLVPIGFGIFFANMPGIEAMAQGVHNEGSVMNLLYQGVKRSIYPPLIFLGIGAMTDFSNLLSNPKLILIGVAAQFGIFSTFMGAYLLGFPLIESAAIGIIGSADGPTSIYLATRLAPHLLPSIALAAYSYMSLVPIIQPPVVRLLTTEKERVIQMKSPRVVSKRERILFPIIGFTTTIIVAPSGAALLSMLFFGNLLRESGVTERLAQTARTALIDICTILIGLTIGATTSSSAFLQRESLLIFSLGAVSFVIATASGVIFAKIMNLFLKEKINPIIGAAGVSAMPQSARVIQKLGQQYNKSNHLLMHAMGPNVASIMGSAVVAGIMIGILS